MFNLSCFYPLQQQLKLPIRIMKGQAVSCWRRGIPLIYHLPSTRRLMRNSSLQPRNKLLCTVSEPSPPQLQLGILSPNSSLARKKKYTTTYITPDVQKCGGNGEIHFPTPINDAPHRRSHSNATCYSMGSISERRSDRNALR